MAMRPMKRSQRAIVFSLINWAIMYMFIDGMRQVAPAFILGLASIDSLVDERDT